MIGDIDLTKKPQKLNLFLAKPDRTVIAKLNEAYGRRQTVKLGNVNELTFSIPYNTDIGHQLVPNQNVALLRDRYLIKALLNGQEEWYIISNIENNMNDSSESKSVTAYSLPYEMTSKTIRNTKLTSVNINTALNGGTYIDDLGDVVQFNGLLAKTKWSLGHVDAQFASLFRTYDFTSSTTILDTLFKIAEITKSILTWDTVNRKINFYDPLTYGNDRGLLLDYGRYMKSLKVQSKSDEMTTIFKVFGQNNVSIQDVNITGQNYLEDYGFFLYPFKRDLNRNVLQSSYYMSDALCHAILDFSQFVQIKQGQFNSLYTQLVTQKVTLTQKQNDLAVILTSLNTAKNSIDLANSKTPPDDSSAFVTQRNNYQTQYNAKQTEINGVQAQIDSLNSQIQSLRSSMQYSTFFTADLLTELKDYQIEKEYSNTSVDIVATSDLMALAQKEFNYLKVPQIVLNIDIVNFLSVIEAQREWNKLILGDIITIRYGHMNLNVSAKIIEFSIDHEQDSISITVANMKDILTDEQKLIKLLYASTSASTTLDMSKSKWDGIDTTRSQVAQMINSTWDANKQMITGGINNTVTISQRGLMITNSTDTLNYLVAQNGILAITNDGGNTWKNALTKDGLVAERVFGKLIAGVNLEIDASDSTGVKTFTVDGNGVTITGTKLTITGGLPANQLDPAYKNGLVNLGTVYNGVTMDSVNGITVQTSDNTKKVLLNASDGLRFQKNIGGTWTDQFWYDTVTGNLNLYGIVNAKDFKINGTSVLTMGGTKIGGQYIDSITTGQITVTSALPDGAIASATNWNNKTTLLTPSGVYTGTLTAGQINAINGITLGSNATITWSQINVNPAVTTAQTTANNAQTSANTAQTTANNIASGNYIGGTFIDSKTIKSPTIQGGDFQIYDGNGRLRLRIYPTYSTNLPAYVLYDPNGSEAGRFVSNYANRCDVVGYGNSSITFSNDTIINGNNVIVQTWGGNFQMSNGDIIATRPWVQANVIAKFG